jgi:hypothetical protein
MRTRAFLQLSAVWSAWSLLLAANTAFAGKVTVPIGARPAQPAAVDGWSGEVTAAAHTALTGKTMAAGDTEAQWIGINFSKHHILPQTYLQVVAGLSVEAQAGNADLRTRLVAAICRLAAGNAGGPPAAWSLGPVAWSPVNLFEGPTGFYRSDDPGEGGETSKPKSFDATRWQKLQTLKGAVDNLGAIAGAQFETSTDKLNKQQTGGKTGFQKLVEAFEALDNAVVRPFTNTDWVSGAGGPFNVADLIVFRDSKVAVAISPSKKNGYKLKP